MSVKHCPHAVDIYHFLTLALIVHSTSIMDCSSVNVIFRLVFSLTFALSPSFISSCFSKSIMSINKYLSCLLTKPCYVSLFCFFFPSGYSVPEFWFCTPLCISPLCRFFHTIHYFSTCFTIHYFSTRFNNFWKLCWIGLAKRNPTVPHTSVCGVYFVYELIVWKNQ